MYRYHQECLPEDCVWTHCSVADLVNHILLHQDILKSRTNMILMIFCVGCYLNS